MSEYVLIEAVATKQRGRPVYFARMTAIGPATTLNREEAKRFASREEADRHPARSFALAVFRPEVLAETTT